MFSDRAKTFGPARDEAPGAVSLESSAADEASLLEGPGMWLLAGASLLVWTALSLLLTSA